ncbi:4-hydroxybutyrate dehydrogenase [Clostridium sp. B9]|uniref:4-hydroxybutyrate dehydrogenase n=1 Tax=Clostridium sp. B9 TaxID=3423224 RepID=UPI003D2EE5D2
MKLFGLKTEMFIFNGAKEFSEALNLNKNDLIFTNRRIFEGNFKELNLNCNYVLKDKYDFNEPNDEVVDLILKDIRDIKFNRVIAIGGGSILDVGKLLALKDVESTRKLFKKEIPVIRDKELVIVPTTCGTGSEVTNISIVEIKSEGTKMGLAVEELYADKGVLIPELCKTMPYKAFVYSSIDALIHSIEGFLSPNSTPYTDLFALKAIEMILSGYMEIIARGEEYRNEIIKDFLIASNYAGIAFGNAGVGAVHALSYPLGGKYHVPHGEANYEFLMSVLNYYNENNDKGKIRELNSVISKVISSSEEECYKNLEKLLNNLIRRKDLREYGMKIEEIELFSDSVIKNQQRLLKNNYVPMKREDIIKIYKELY